RYGGFRRRDTDRHHRGRHRSLRRRSLHPLATDAGDLLDRHHRLLGRTGPLRPGPPAGDRRDRFDRQPGIMHWRATALFRGRPTVIVAGGPSLDLAQVRAVAMARAGDRIRVVAVNDAVYPCWFADIAYACDRKWWRYHNGLPGFPGRKLSLE